MIYVFKGTELLRTVEISHYWTVEGYNEAMPKAFPTDCHLYESEGKKWYVKRTRRRVRPIPAGMVPKEWKAMLLLLGVPL